MEKKSFFKSPVFIILLGLVYALIPDPIPFIDDIIVNIITSGIAFYLMIAQNKAEQFIKDKTGHEVSLDSARMSCQESLTKKATTHRNNNGDMNSF
jgi:hypothetical protein